MELYLKNVLKTVEFQKELESVALITEVEYNGNENFKDIFILVNLANILTKKLY